ncbi:MAG TPA: SGNH/GDSL hydrolase family protein [Acidimicrobiales bacterium]|nr:SGNH/GDSL hydrolase family protein [Acidimicrobiales bacterium]
MALLCALLPAKAAAAQDPFVYVAMGDSYTSGPLVMPHDTRWVPQDCGQSMRNYPHLVNLLLHPDIFRDVSCGSATIDDFYRPQTGLPLGNTNAPQLWALNDKVDAVTVGIGGNDAGFVGDALDCIRAEPEGVGTQPDCVDQFVRNGVDKISQSIEQMRIKLGTALDDIHKKAPHAAVFVVSYPDALPDNRLACWPYVPFRPRDMAYLVRKFKEMNRAERSAAEAHNATYVDIYTPSIGHDACKPPALAWVNAVVLVPPSFPAHPNDLSFVHSAPVVARAIRAKLHMR